MALFSIQESLLQYAMIPCVHLCVAPFLGKTVFSVSSSLFQIQEELIFSIYSPFYIYSNGMVTFKCLIHRTRIHPKYSFFNGRRYFFSSTCNSLAKQVTKCWVHDILIHHLVCKESFLMEKEMATHSSALAWKIPWLEEPGRLQSMGSRRVRHDWATSLSLFTFMHWRRKWQPIPVFLPRESQGWRGLVGCYLWSCTESYMTDVT